MSVLKLGIPKGSLEKATIELFEKSGWRIKLSSRNYFPEIDDDEPVDLCEQLFPPVRDEVRILLVAMVTAGKIDDDSIEEHPR